MQLRKFDVVQDFYFYIKSFLLQHEAEHNLILGLCNTLIDNPMFYQHPYMGVIEDNGEIQAVAMRTPPHNFVISRISEGVNQKQVLDLFAQDAHNTYGTLTGVSSRPEVSKAFADLWNQQTGQGYHLNMAQRIYQLNRVIPPLNIPGSMRHSTLDDRELLVDWTHAFRAEALEAAPREESERTVDRFFGSESRGLYLWEVDGQPVSMTAYTGPTPHGMRITLVYTPPELRRKGYAGALVAEVSQAMLDRDYQFCFLYTDLSNPTSNHIYQQIGYEEVCDVDEYRFTQSGHERVQALTRKQPFPAVHRKDAGLQAVLQATAPEYKAFPVAR